MRLTEAQKLFVVQELACFRTPTEVCERVKEEYGFEMDRRQVGNYDPRRGAISKKLLAAFHQAREAFLEETASIPVANKAFRLRELGELYVRAKQARNAPLAASLLEQAAKESGGAYTNVRELTGKGGRDLVPARVEVVWGADDDGPV